MPEDEPAYLWKQFQGYRDIDVAFMRGLRVPDLAPDENCLTDFFGMRVDVLSEPLLAGRMGQWLSEPPFPTDGWLAEGVEYAALALALAHARGGFVAVELGAGFGPWIALSAICARRLGLGPIHLVGVEADPARHRSMHRHLEMNGLIPPHAGFSGSAGGLSWDLRQAIIWQEEGEALWPEGMFGDAGLRAVPADQQDGLDYRGRALPLRSMPAVSLSALLAPLEAVDFLHMDIQGAEYEVLKAGLPALCERVKFMMVACHSRLIEGQVMELLFANGWFLERQEPCGMTPAVAPDSLEAMTFIDGGQVWRNLRFSEADLWVRRGRP